MSGYLYLGEGDGGRIIRVTPTATTHVTTASTTPTLSRLETWDLVPAGPSGDVVFRMVIVTVAYDDGYQIRVTPSVDGVALLAQDFSGSGRGTADCQAFVARRGARLSVVCEQLARTGSHEWVDVQAAYLPIRVVP